MLQLNESYMNPTSSFLTAGAGKVKYCVHYRDIIGLLTYNHAALLIKVTASNIVHAIIETHSR